MAENVLLLGFPIMTIPEAAPRRRKSDGYPVRSRRVKPENSRRSYAREPTAYHVPLSASAPHDPDALASAAAAQAETYSESEKRLEYFEGERPNDRIMGEAPVDLVPLAECDSKQRGRAMRKGWRPRAMYAAKLITKRQLAAACDVVSLFETGFTAPIKGSSFGERVEGGGAGGPAPDGMLDASMKYKRVMARLCEVQRAIVFGVCIGGQTVEAVAARAHAAWLPSSAQMKQCACKALLCAGLDSIADALKL
jgi:hypothetical protein